MKVKVLLTYYFSVVFCGLGMYLGSAISHWFLLLYFVGCLGVLQYGKLVAKSGIYGL